MYWMFYAAEAFDQNLRVDSSGEQSKWNKLDDISPEWKERFCDGAVDCGDPEF
jgi:hypothetical protein